MHLIDTNIIVRFLTNDEPKLASQAGSLLGQSVVGSLELTDVIFVEIAFVLISNYQMEKKKLVEALALLIDLESISCDRPLLRETLAIFEAKPISVVDSYLLAKTSLGRNAKLVTFDKKLAKLAISSV